MTTSHEKDIAVIIPARDEEDRIAACLTAMAGQYTARVTVIVVLNNTTDLTGDIARNIAGRNDLDLIVLSHILAKDQGVETARRIGCNHALQGMPLLRYLLTTDADCMVAPDWIARNLAHLRTVDAVCGKVDLITGEADIFDGMARHLATLEGIYRKLVQDIYARHAPGCGDLAGTHGEAAGASLAFSRLAYLAVGGFDPVICGEDRRIVRAFRGSGHSVRHASNVTVQASCRLTGRAAGGMSDALKARIGGTDYKIDECLPPAEWLVLQVGCQTLGPWPPQVPAQYRLNVRDLPRHIAILENFRNLGGLTPASIAPVDTEPCSHTGMLQPDRASAIVLADSDLQACRIRANSVPATTQTIGSAEPTAIGA